MASTAAMAIALTLSLTSACSSEGKLVQTKFSNEGTVCLLPPSGGQPEYEDYDGGQIGADDDLEVHVVFDRCGSYCAEVLNASCTAELAGDRISVTSEASIEERKGEGVTCETACRVRLHLRGTTSEP